MLFAILVLVVPMIVATIIDWLAKVRASKMLENLD